MANSFSSLTTIMTGMPRPARVGGFRIRGIPDVPPLAISTPQNVISELLPALQQAGMIPQVGQNWSALPTAAPTSMLVAELERVLPGVLNKRSSPLADISKLLLLLCDLFSHHQPHPSTKSLFRLVISALDANWATGPHSDLTNSARCALVQLSIQTSDNLDGLAWLVARSRDEQWSMAHWVCTGLRWPSIISAMRKTSSLLVRAHLAALLECIAVIDPLWEVCVAECSMVIKVDTTFKDALRLGSLAVVRHLANIDQSAVPTAIPHSSGWIALDRDGIWINDCFISKQDVISCKGGCIMVSPQTPRQMFSLAMTFAHTAELDRLVAVITGRLLRPQLSPTPARSATPLTGTSNVPILVDTPEKRRTVIKSSPSRDAPIAAVRQSLAGPSRHRPAPSSIRSSRATPNTSSRTSTSSVHSPRTYTFPNVQLEDLTYAGATFAQVCKVKIEDHEATGLVMPTITVDQIKAFPVRSDVYQLPLAQSMAGHLSQGVFVPVPAILDKVMASHHPARANSSLEARSIFSTKR